MDIPNFLCLGSDGARLSAREVEAALNHFPIRRPVTSLYSDRPVVPEMHLFLAVEFGGRMWRKKQVPVRMRGNEDYKGE